MNLCFHEDTIDAGIMQAFEASSEVSHSQLVTILLSASRVIVSEEAIKLLIISTGQRYNHPLSVITPHFRRKFNSPKFRFDQF